MRRPLLTLLLALAAAHPARADDPAPDAPPDVTPGKPADAPKPVEVAVAPGVPLPLAGSPTAKATRFEFADPAAAAAAALTPAADGKGATFFSVTAGRYLVVAYTARGDVPSRPTRIWVTVGVPVPPAPPPPPVPPVPPAPADPLVAALKAAYAADPADAAGKREHLLDLVAIFKQAQGTAQVTTMASVSAVIERVKASAADMGLKPADLAAVRTAIAAELRKLFPADAPLDDPARARLVAAFERIRAALAGV